MITTTAPRLPYDVQENLDIVFAVHENGGPRAVWYTQYGNMGDKPATSQVEDAAAEFYNAYNAEYPGTF